MMQRNPFSTRFTRPGSLPFLFPKGSSIDRLVARLEATAYQGAIVGPHGSGKSTLLETLHLRWSKMGITEQRVRLTASQKCLAIDWSQLGPDSILVIDGFEQLSFWRQRWIRWRCRRQRSRLMVTCHAPCGIPVVLRTQADWELARTLAGVLLERDATAYENELRKIWDEQPGDIRAYFFRLYHWCESQRIYQPMGDSYPPQSLPV
ncbi:hypothetical protein [Bremerella cremea]|uniref:hypothetical protein n=1 Tax=Bremerella cremea TaxID=1031537 RepID=UPI0031EEC945